MKHLYYSLLALLLSLAMLPAGAQSSSEAFPLGTTQDFLQQLKQNTNANTNGQTANAAPLLTVPVSATQTLSLRVNVQEAAAADQLTLIGSVVGEPNSSFYLRVEGDNLVGDVLLKYQGQAYEYTADAQGNAFVEAKDLDEVLCVGYPEPPAPKKALAPTPIPKASGVLEAPGDLQSLAGAPRCMLLDFNGEYVVGTPWEEGRPINAAPARMSGSDIVATWELVSEDFRPFNVNITTSEAVFNRYPKDRRMRCIITPTNTAAPGAGGVAYLGSFNWNDDTPCWVFQDTRPKSCGEAVSHELGHTVALSHDTAPGQGPKGYYTGQGDWAPIMGVGYYKPISQWNRGEYNNAYNREDDLAIIDRYLGYRGDDHGNNFSSATTINVRSNNQIGTQAGVIERTGDQDFFRFRCGTGNVSLDVNTVDRYGNLDIQVNLYEGRSGKLIGRFNEGGLNTKLTARLDAGEYYLAVDGVGAGNPATTGYSDYGSLGSFTIAGTIPSAGDDGGAIATLYEDCDFQGQSFSLGEGNYDLAALRARGYTDNQLSSLTVKSGYEVTLYDGSSFNGRAGRAAAGNYACLVNSGFNDIISSVVVRRTGAGGSQQIEAENYSAMQGVQVEEGSEGPNVGYIDQGDWMAFSGINFPSSGNYRIEYRVASPATGGRFTLDINAGARVLGEMTVPQTGGWQNWTTISQTIRLDADTYDLGIYAQSGQWNINWIRITALGNGATARTDQLAKGKSSVPLLSLVETDPVQVTVYPNPVASRLSVTVPTQGWADSHMSIIDIQGKRVWEGNYQPTLDMSRFKTGIYSVLIEKSGQRLVRRFIKE